jgi:hypothetical protein
MRVALVRPALVDALLPDAGRARAPVLGRLGRADPDPAGAAAPRPDARQQAREGPGNPT